MPITRTPRENLYALFVMNPTAAFLRNESGKWKQSNRGDQQVFTREIPYRGVVVLMGTEKQLTGVSGISDSERATVLLESLAP